MRACGGESSDPPALHPPAVHDGLLYRERSDCGGLGVPDRESQPGAGASLPLVGPGADQVATLTGVWGGAPCRPSQCRRQGGSGRR